MALAQTDSFIQQREAEVTKNASTGFSISFADDRRAFHPGETIKLVFTFRRHDVSPFNYASVNRSAPSVAVIAPERNDVHVAGEWLGCHR
jgi:hypothetical protein